MLQVWREEEEKHITSSFIIITFIYFCFKINWTFVLMVRFGCSLLAFLSYSSSFSVGHCLQFSFVDSLNVCCAYLSIPEIKCYCDGIEDRKNGKFYCTVLISIWPNPNCYYFNFLFSWVPCNNISHSSSKWPQCLYFALQFIK